MPTEPRSLFLTSLDLEAALRRQDALAQKWTDLETEIAETERQVQAAARVLASAMQLQPNEPQYLPVGHNHDRRVIELWTDGTEMVAGFLTLVDPLDLDAQADDDDEYSHTVNPRLDAIDAEVA
jgi:hypothetical protein